MIKALIMDLDGTLLNSAKTISAQDKETLIKCKMKGLDLFFATARPPLLETMFSSFGDIIKLFNGGIFYNGGLLKYDNTYKYTLIDQKCLEIILSSILSFDNCNVALQMEFEQHAFRIPSEINIDSWGIMQNKQMDFDYVIKNLSYFHIVKVLLFYGDITKPQKKLPDDLIFSINKYNDIKVYITDHQKVAQIMHSSANKENAINILCCNKNYKKENIAFFGDDDPDRVALLNLPYSIAMNNSPDHIKQAARFITLDNNSSGVSYAIYNILKILD